MNMQLLDDDAFAFLCRHFVSLSGWYHPRNLVGDVAGEEQFFGYSGFLYSVNGMWCFVTAGHILQELDAYLAEGKIELTETFLVDSFGPEIVSNEPIPFEYKQAPKFYLHDKAVGLDFGLIALRPYYQALLEANNAIPVSRENWIHQHEIEFDFYMLIGLPRVLISTEVVDSGPNRRRAGYIIPVQIPLSPLDPPPSDLRQTQFPRLVAKIHDSCPLEDIQGMSGGPILGFATLNGNLRYWVTAIQSSWLKSRKIIFGCPVPLFGMFIERLLEEKE